MRICRFLAVLSIALVFLGACNKDDNNVQSDNPRLFVANGDIQPVIEQFRLELGNLNTAPGATGGRREISWEIVPDDLLDKKLPGQFFNQTGENANPSLQRGLIYDPNMDFRVSKTAFASMDADASSEFSAFSGTATFANVSVEPWAVTFQVAGTNDAAGTRGFGMVVSDVDVSGTVSLEFFNGTQSLGKLFVPARQPGSNFSFAGVLYEESIITSVKVSHHGILGTGVKDVSQGGTHDLVVLDDFIYGEPEKK